MHLDLSPFSKALLQDVVLLELLIQRADASHLQNVILSHDFSSLGAHLEHSAHSQKVILPHASVDFAAEQSSQPSWQDSLEVHDRSFCAHEVLAVHRGSSPFTIGSAALRMQRIVASTRILAVVLRLWKVVWRALSSSMRSILTFAGGIARKDCAPPLWHPCRRARPTDPEAHGRSRYETS